MNISVNGLLFKDNGALQPGQRVLVPVKWPVLLDQRIPLNLKGRILRSGNGQATFGPNTLDSFRVWTDEIPVGEIPGTAD
jgi:hypothetical protein